MCSPTYKLIGDQKCVKTNPHTHTHTQKNKTETQTQMSKANDSLSTYIKTTTTTTKNKRNHTFYQPRKYTNSHAKMKKMILVICRDLREQRAHVFSGE